MKLTAALSLILALSASSIAIAQPAGMNGMGMHDKGMDMKDKGMEKMKDMHTKHESMESKTMTYQATGVVKTVDAANGKITLAHEAVKSLKWPAMTRGFAVNDKTLFDALAVGKKVEFEFIQQGSDYLVTAVK